MLKESLNGHDGLYRSLDVVRANPLPFALIGIGAAWLIASNTGIAAQIARIAEDERVEAVRRRAVDLVAGVASDIGTRAGQLASDVAATVGLGEQAGAAAARPLGHTGNPLVDQGVGESGRAALDGWVHQATDLAQEALRSARDSGGAMLNRAGGYAGDGANRIASQLSGAFERHPLAIGTIGIIAGAALALLLPATRTEDSVLGDTKDELWHKAQEAGHQAVARVREVGARATARAADAAATAVRGETGTGETGTGETGNPSQS
jgi:hypothetical protein